MKERNADGNVLAHSITVTVELKFSLGTLRRQSELKLMRANPYEDRGFTPLSTPGSSKL